MCCTVLPLVDGTTFHLIASVICMLLLSIKHSAGSVDAGVCAKELLVHNIGTRQHGYEVQLCCEVASIWLSPAIGVWQLDSRVRTRNIADMTTWADRFPIMKCKNQIIWGEYFGNTRGNDDEDGEKCERKLGATIPLIFDRDILADRWYMMCYRFEHADCAVCSFRRFCAMQPSLECQNIWLRHDVTHVSNTSMNFSVQFGDALPFTGSARIALYKQRLNADSLLLSQWTVLARSSFSQQFQADDLQPDNYYVWSVCVQLKPQKGFMEKYKIQMVDGMQTICAENITYKTLGGDPTRYGYRREWDTGAATNSRRTFSTVFLTICVILATSRKR